MKSQIALVGIGLAIAAGVAYVELKPTSNNPIAPVVEASAAPAPTKAATELQSPVPKTPPLPIVSKPTIPKPTITGGDDDEEDDENNEDDERDGEEDDD
jgi:hypothetical protein